MKHSQPKTTDNLFALVPVVFVVVAALASAFNEPKQREKIRRESMVEVTPTVAVTYPPRVIHESQPWGSTTPTNSPMCR